MQEDRGGDAHAPEDGPPLPGSPVHVRKNDEARDSQTLRGGLDSVVSSMELGASASAALRAMGGVAPHSSMGRVAPHSPHGSSRGLSHRERGSFSQSRPLPTVFSDDGAGLERALAAAEALDALDAGNDLGSAFGPSASIRSLGSVSPQARKSGSVLSWLTASRPAAAQAPQAADSIPEDGAPEDHENEPPSPHAGSHRSSSGMRGSFVVDSSRASGKRFSAANSGSFGANLREGSFGGSAFGARASTGSFGMFGGSSALGVGSSGLGVGSAGLSSGGSAFSPQTSAPSVHIEHRRSQRRSSSVASALLSRTASFVTTALARGGGFGGTSSGGVGAERSPSMLSGTIPGGEGGPNAGSGEEQGPSQAATVARSGSLFGRRTLSISGRRRSTLSQTGDSAHLTELAKLAVMGVGGAVIGRHSGPSASFAAAESAQQREYERLLKVWEAYQAKVRLRKSPVHFGRGFRALGEGKELVVGVFAEEGAAMATGVGGAGGAGAGGQGLGAFGPLGAGGHSPTDGLATSDRLPTSEKNAPMDRHASQLTSYGSILQYAGEPVSGSADKDRLKRLFPAELDAALQEFAATRRRQEMFAYSFTWVNVVILGWLCRVRRC